MEPAVITVSQFVGIINETLSFAYPEVVVEGEVSSFKVNQGKFVFFDLKDDQNVLSCFMMLRQLKLPIEDGMKIRATGSPKITKFSKFSLTVRETEIAGQGQLRRAMELLRQQLEREGLFAAARKRPIPAFPQRLGLITSATSAAYADFIKILAARWGGLNVILADVSVQGRTAPDEIVGALGYFNQLADPVDVVIIIRGGGSLEDLMAFSTEPVARAIAASRTPTIVGVGHEVDVSLADYAADVRAATPTDAARLVVPDRTEITARVEHHRARQEQLLINHVNLRLRRLTEVTSRLENYVAIPRRQIDQHEARLWRGLDRLAAQTTQQRRQTGYLESRLGNFSRLVISSRRQQLDHQIQLLHGYNPAAVLRRGYAIVRHGQQIVTSPAAVQPGDRLMIQLAQDQLAAEVRPNE